MRALYFIAMILVLLVSTTSADTLRIPDVRPPPNSPEGVLRPVRGMTMEAVLSRFGEPRQRLPATGDPPITRWIYDRFTVYFEGSVTLHSVVHQK